MKQNNAPPVLYCCYCTYSNVSSRVPGGLGPDHFILGSGSRTMQGSLDLTFPHIFLFSAVPHYSGTNFIAVLTALRIRIVKETSAVIPVTMETRCFHKKLEFQRHPPKDFCTARYEHKSSKKNQTFQKPRRKKILGRSWAKIGLRKQPNISSKRRDSESWTDIDRQN